MKERQVAQTTYSAKWMQKKRKKVTECIATWFSEAGIPSNTVCLESFNLMLEAVGNFGPGLRGPSPDELDGPLLQRQVLAINDSFEALKKYWALEGCSVLVNRGIGDNDSYTLNLGVHCSQGVSFLRSIHLSPDADDESYVFELVDSCIKEVGENSVVQVVTDISSESLSARLLIEKRPNIFWTACAADSIGLMLQGIGSIRLIRKTIAKARLLTAFIYGQTHLLSMTRQFTSQWDLVHVGINYYTTCILNLKKIYDKRIELKGMFISKEWEDSKWSNGAVGKKFYNLVVSNEFWHGVLYTINSFEPLVNVLRRTGSGGPSMGYIYGELEKAKREIALRFENKEEHYLPIWEHIDFRMCEELMTPLHIAGYYLNPFFFYQHKDEIEDVQIFKDALAECTRKMFQDQLVQEKIMNQLELYRTASESFGTAQAINTRMNLDPVSWWELHGVAAKELSIMALRLLRLTSGSLSLACEESWIEKLHIKKPCWVKRKQFEDSMFVTVNRRIQGKAQMRNRDPVLAYVPDEDEPFEWLVGRFRVEAQRYENNAFRMARANSSKEALVGLSMQDKKLLDYDEYTSTEEVDEDSDEEPPTSDKKATSSASCSKRVKRPRSGKGFLWDNKGEGSDGEVY